MMADAALRELHGAFYFLFGGTLGEQFQDGKLICAQQRCGVSFGHQQVILQPHGGWVLHGDRALEAAEPDLPAELIHGFGEVFVNVGVFVQCDNYVCHVLLLMSYRSKNYFYNNKQNAKYCQENRINIINLDRDGYPVQWYGEPSPEEDRRWKGRITAPG